MTEQTIEFSEQDLKELEDLHIDEDMAPPKAAATVLPELGDDELDLPDLEG